MFWPGVTEVPIYVTADWSYYVAISTMDGGEQPISSAFARVPRKRDLGSGGSSSGRIRSTIGFRPLTARGCISRARKIGCKRGGEVPTHCAGARPHATYPLRTGPGATRKILPLLLPAVLNETAPEYRSVR